MSNSTLYETDFHAWANQQAELLRAGNVAAADLANIAEEIESMGKSEKRELASRLAVLLTHLLKWQYQPTHQSGSWRATINIQRRALERHINDNPSLKPNIPTALTEAYADSRDSASAETGLPDDTFPALCPWTYDQTMDANFWPSTRTYATPSQT